MFRKLGDEAAKKLTTFKPQEMANAAWAIGRSKLPLCNFFEALQRRLQSFEHRPEGLTDFGPQHLAMMLCAIGNIFPAGKGGDSADGSSTSSDDEDRGSSVLLPLTRIE